MKNLPLFPKKNSHSQDQVHTEALHYRFGIRKRTLLFGVVAGLFLLIGTVVFASEIITDREDISSYPETIQMGGEWFLNNENEEFLHYEYQPLLGKYSEEKQRLREMAAMWAIAKLGNYLGDESYTRLAEKGLDFFDDSFKEDPETGGLFVNIEPDSIKIAYNAFALLALSELDDPESDKYIEPLKQELIAQQMPSGELDTFLFSDRDSGVDYYPGEAMFALMTLHEKSPDAKIVETVAKAFPFYRDYWRGNKNTAFVPWQTRAYRKLYAANSDPEVKDFVFEMNDWLLDEFARTKGKCTAFKFRGITAAVQMEGVIQAYTLAKEVGDVKRTACYAKFVRDGANFIRELQVTSEAPFGKPAYGGFFGKKVPKDYRSVPQDKLPTLRVDNNQHAVVALMEAKEAGIIK